MSDNTHLAEKTKLSNKEIFKSVFVFGGKFFLANLLTSFIIVAFLFIIAVIIGFDSDKGLSFFKSPVVHTIMLPLIVWYFGYIAYSNGYKQSVSGKYDKRKIFLACIPIVVVQTIFVLLAIKESENVLDFYPMKTVALFFLNPYSIVFNLLPDFMPEIMLPFVVVEPVAMIIGYRLAEKKEIEDHSIKEDAQEFRRRLEKEQYEKYNSDSKN